MCGARSSRRCRTSSTSACSSTSTKSRAAAAEDSDAFELLWWGKKLSGLTVTLAAVDRERLEELLDDAWRRKAPKRLVAELHRP